MGEVRDGMWKGMVESSPLGVVHYVQITLHQLDGFLWYFAPVDDSLPGCFVVVSKIRWVTHAGMDDDEDG